MMDATREVFDLAQAAAADRAHMGGKARVLGELAVSGFSVPSGLVVTAAALNIDGWERSLDAAARSLGAERFAVRSSGIYRTLPTPACTRRT
jgi:phosphoenolpyruvate synthase/pyruvate phosphate dikinase